MRKTTWTKMWSDRPYSLHLMSMVTEATVHGFRKIFPSSRISRGIIYWEDGKCSYLFESRELRETARFLAEESLKSPKFLLEFLEGAFRWSVELRKMTEKYKKINLSKCPSQELEKYIEEYSREFHKFYSQATIAPLLGYQDENPIYQKMDAIIREKTKECPEKYSDYYTALTSSPKKLKTNLMDMEILKLAEKAKKRGIKTKKELVRKYKQELKEITNRYESLSFDFCDSVSWAPEYFAILTLEKMKTDIQKKLDELTSLEKTSEQNFEKAVQELKLSRKEIEVCNLVKYLGFQKWAREYEFQEAQYNLKPVQDELGKRARLTTLESKYLLSEEYKFLLKDPIEYKKIALGRIKKSLCLVQAGRGTRVFVDQEAKKLFTKMKMTEPAKIPKTKTLKGMPASPGKASGIVKIIINKRDSEKMRKGNVLVSQATGPDLLPVMKLAAAIVTNEGGITAHAAIVSRELKIPCIVGTKIATKVLRDGDLVEVDANQGIVKILKKR